MAGARDALFQNVAGDVVHAAFDQLRRRFGITGSGAHLSVLQILPVGPRERVVLLKTRAGRILAIGVSAQSVNLITRLEQDDVAADPEPSP